MCITVIYNHSTEIAKQNQTASEQHAMLHSLRKTTLSGYTDVASGKKVLKSKRQMSEQQVIQQGSIESAVLMTSHAESFHQLMLRQTYLDIRHNLLSWDHGSAANSSIPREECGGKNDEKVQRRSLLLLQHLQHHYKPTVIAGSRRASLFQCATGTLLRKLPLPSHRKRLKRPERYS